MEHWTEVLGIAERRGDEILKLSLGNQQRVQLAAALVHSPDILVLDEPFSGLDPVAVDVMSGVLREQAAAGVPVLFSSHQLELVESLCDRVGIIKSGSMVEFGGIEELRRTDDRRWVVDGPPAASWFTAVPSAQRGVHARAADRGRGARAVRRRRRPGDPARGDGGRPGARVQPRCDRP